VKLSQPLTLSRGVRAAASRAPSKPAMIAEGQSLTYAEMLTHIDAMATGLLARGVRAGDRVALISPNCPEYLELVIAATEPGAMTVLINPRLTAPEIALILEDCRPALVVVHDSLKPLVAARPEPVCSFADLAATPATRQPDQADEFAPFAIHYTSGTTGKPKGVPVTHRSRILSFFGMASEFGCYGADDHFLALAPFCHGAGLTFALGSLYTGGTVTVIDRYDAASVATALASGAITGIFVVPTHFHRMFELPADQRARLKNHKLKALICNAAPLKQPDKLRVIEMFGEGVLFECYGATESGVVTTMRPQYHRLKEDCVGTPFAATEVELRDENGNPVPDNIVGELFSRSPYLFDGYWERPQDSAEAIHGDWVTVGDMARRDADGFYYIVDRKKDMIISGGINVYPREIEAVLLTLPGIIDCAVVGVPDPEWGERIHAELVAAPGTPLDVPTIAQACRDRLAGYKQPRTFRIVEALPRNANGKILKREIRDTRAAEERAKVA
jgi:long-chain acyl-CoA synthetase